MTSNEGKEHCLLPIFIGLFIVIVFGGLFTTTIKDINKSMNQKIYMNKVIESNSKKNGKNAYIKITSISTMFAKENNNKGYYFVSDGNYNYIVLLDKKAAGKILDANLENKPVTISGITRETSDELKKIALEVYNSGYDENEQISIEDYYSYFGDIYLDQTVAIK